MKINIYCNDYFTRYNHSQPEKALTQLRSGYIYSIANNTDMFILRGEPTLHYDFERIVSSFPEGNYILTTHGNNVDAIIGCKKTIPYISFNWDGFANDDIKGIQVSSDIMRTLQFLKSKKTKVRIAYTINPFNIKWLSTDAIILKKMMEEYQNMVQPYFMMYQQGAYYSQPDFVWTAFTYDHLKMLNELGLLTAKNFAYLKLWTDHASKPCISPLDNVVIMPDATVRICQSYKMDTILGSLNEKNLDDILSSSLPQRERMINCEFKDKCWFACNTKDSLDE